MKLIAAVVAVTIAFPAVAFAQVRASDESQPTRTRAQTSSQTSLVAVDADRRTLAVAAGPQKVALAKRSGRIVKPYAGRPETVAARRAQVAQAAEDLGLQAGLGGIQESAFLDFKEWEWHKPNQISLQIWGNAQIFPQENTIKFRTWGPHQGDRSSATLHYWVSPANVGKPHLIGVECSISGTGDIAIWHDTDVGELAALEATTGVRTFYVVAEPQTAGEHRFTMQINDEPDGVTLIRASINVVSP